MVNRRIAKEDHQVSRSFLILAKIILPLHLTVKIQRLITSSSSMKLRAKHLISLRTVLFSPLKKLISGHLRWFTGHGNGPAAAQSTVEPQQFEMFVTAKPSLKEVTRKFILPPPPFFFWTSSLKPFLEGKING